METHTRRVIGRAGVAALAATLVLLSASAGAATGKPTIAVLAFDTQGTRVLVNPSYVVVIGDVDVTTRRLSDDLIAALTRSGRFTVVERDRVAALAGEGSRTDTGAVDSAPKIGVQLGADYVLTGRIAQVRAHSEQRNRPYTDSTETLHSGRMDVFFRLVSTRGGVVTVADKVTATHARTVPPGRDYTAGDFLGELREIAVRLIVERVVTGNFPGQSPAAAAGGRSLPDASAPGELTPGSSDKPIKW